MTSFTAVRSAFRSSSALRATAKFASSSAAAAAAKPKPSSSHFGLPKKQTRPAPRILRYPVESSFCVESLLPMHSVTASAIMTSMLSISRSGHGWLAEDS